MKKLNEASCSGPSLHRSPHMTESFDTPAIYFSQCTLECGIVERGTYYAH